MILNNLTGEYYRNRKDAKERLGGLGQFNKSMRRGELLFIYDGGSFDNEQFKQKLSYEELRKEQQ